jgi:dihydroxyacetone kinase
VSGPVSIPVAVFKAGLVSAGERLSAARDELCALDAVAGDGDLGVTLASGFAHVQEALATLDATDAGALLVEVGRQLARNAPSTIGALLGTAFLRAGKQLEGVLAVDARQVAVMLDAAAAGVVERGGAAPGQRTIIDAMVPAAAAATTAAERGADAIGALAAAAEAAQAGVYATTEMEPQVGRAGWIADRARGHQDAGAAAWAIYLAALTQACRAASPEEAD